MPIEFAGRVAIVTGSGQGLGRHYALALARLGAKVVVNDLGTSVEGASRGEHVATSVVREILELGGQAIASTANVCDFGQVEDMVQHAISKWGRVDILVNNAGILRDKSFVNMSLDSMRSVIEVHLFGSLYCCKAVWPFMREQQYGRIVNVTSSSGLYGNFGQVNYSAAKMGLVGVTNSLHLEGQKYNIKVNALCPVAKTRMTAPVLNAGTSKMLTPGGVAAAVLFLASEHAPERVILTAGAGVYCRAMVCETAGSYLGSGSPDELQKHWSAIASADNLEELTEAKAQTAKLIRIATDSGDRM